MHTKIIIRKSEGKRQSGTPMQEIQEKIEVDQI
jgi:hypothetical protein